MQPVYALAQLEINDRTRYDAYAARFLATLRPYGGRLLAADEAPLVIEGSWPFDKVVLLQFADRASFHSWWTSPEYQTIVGERIASTRGPILLFHAYRHP